MARIRSLKPGFCTSEDIASLSIPARLHYARLWSYFDDHGRCVDNPKLIKAALWPLDDDVTADVVRAYMDELVAAGLVQRYDAEGRSYAYVVKWFEHQKPNRRLDPQHPEPPDVTVEDSCTADALHEQCGHTPVVGEGEVEGEGSGAPSSQGTLTLVADATESDDDGFDEFWQAYPPRKGVKRRKQDAVQRWAKLKPADRRAVMVALGNYVTSSDVVDGYAMDAARFIGPKAEWRDWLTATTAPTRPTEGAAGTSEHGEEMRYLGGRWWIIRDGQRIRTESQPVAS